MKREKLLSEASVFESFSQKGLWFQE